MTKIWERKTRDVNQIKYIKDGAYQLLVKDDDIKHRWRDYFNKLFNGETESCTIELDDSLDDTITHFMRWLQESEVKKGFGKDEKRRRQ
jgi:hypothetical protein